MCHAESAGEAPGGSGMSARGRMDMAGLCYYCKAPANFWDKFFATYCECGCWIHGACRKNSAVRWLKGWVMCPSCGKAMNNPKDD